MGSGPKDAFAPGTDDEFGLLACDMRRDARGGLPMSKRFKRRIAFHTSAFRGLVDDERNPQFLPQLLQLVTHGIMHNQRRSAGKNVPAQKIAVARQKPSAFANDPFHDRSVVDIPLVCRIVSEQPKPAR